MGSSPLTRGKRGRLGLLLYGGRLIPTHAGKTLPAWAPTLLARAHPRSRGENIAAAPCCGTTPGSSPLTRGKHGAEPGESLDQGLIPARAGKTDEEPRRGGAQRAHPRSRGENSVGGLGGGDRLGSSPLTRGKLESCEVRQGVGGLIPAHAGKTSSRKPSSKTLRAHPRSRGENHGLPIGEGHVPGSSPLTRGKPTTARWQGTHPGLIPAHAGKTVSAIGGPIRGWAHPRSRGENIPGRAGNDPGPGSSPLTRGKHETGQWLGPKVGLIPAHAGKTLLFANHLG